jgi:60 kDa SS-A/Ro ribonucleoprotein
VKKTTKNAASLYAGVVNTKQTPQTQPIPGSSQVANSAGGFSFEVNDFDRLQRFLILGSEGGSYYIGEQKLTRDNAAAVTRCIKADGLRTVAQIVKVSDEGRAPKNAPAEFALALCLRLGDDATKLAARKALPKVCRIPTHLFGFVESIKAIGGFGPAVRKSIAAWYTEQDPNQLAMNLIKYQSRNGWSNADLLRKSHAKAKSESISSLFQWATGHMFDERHVVETAQSHLSAAAKQKFIAQGKSQITIWTPKAEAKDKFLSTKPSDEALTLVWAFEKAKQAKKADEIVSLISTYGLPRECIPTNFLNDIGVWEALLDNKGKGMPLTALVRNLPKMTSIGLIKPLSDASQKVVAALNAAAIKKARLHPLNLIIALRQYEQGHGDKGSLTWKADQQVIAALEQAVHLSFEAVEPTNKRFLFGLDVSGSMGGPIAGLPITSAEAGAVLALVAATVEPRTYVHGFADTFKDLGIRKGQSIKEASKRALHSNFGTTDCAVPMTYALKNRLEVDMFIVCTDSETYAGSIHPSQALRKYRAETGIPAKLVVLATTSSSYTIADPDDAGMLDVVGFDTSVPRVVADFAVK